MRGRRHGAAVRWRSSLALGACSKNTGTDTAAVRPTPSGRRRARSRPTPKDSLGPAPEVAGAAKGGTFTVLRENKISHLDPQRIYSFAGLMNAPLYART